MAGAEHYELLRWKTLSQTGFSSYQSLFCRHSAKLCCQTLAPPWSLSLSRPHWRFQTNKTKRQWIVFTLVPHHRQLGCSFCYLQKLTCSIWVGISPKTAQTKPRSLPQHIRIFFEVDQLDLSNSSSLNSITSSLIFLDKWLPQKGQTKFEPNINHTVHLLHKNSWICSIASLILPP